MCIYNTAKTIVNTQVQHRKQQQPRAMNNIICRQEEVKIVINKSTNQKCEVAMELLEYGCYGEK